MLEKTQPQLHRSGSNTFSFRGVPVASAALQTLFNHVCAAPAALSPLDVSNSTIMCEARSNFESCSLIRLNYDNTTCLLG